MPKMTAVFLPGNKQVEIRAVPVPSIGPDEVLVEIKASCICRSDLSLYYGNAVISGGDRLQFSLLLENEAARQGVRAAESGKQQSKRRRAV